MPRDLLRPVPVIDARLGVSGYHADGERGRGALGIIRLSLILVVIAATAVAGGCASPAARAPEPRRDGEEIYAFLHRIAPQALPMVFGGNIMVHRLTKEQARVVRRDAP